LLRYVWVDGKPYGFKILNEALASWYQREIFTYSHDYKAIDERNQSYKLGMWNKFCKAQDAYIKQTKEFKNVSYFVDKILS
jgi:hypothetical protein